MAPDGSEDIEVYREDNPEYSLEISTTNNGKFFLLQAEGATTSECLVLSTQTPRGSFRSVNCP